MMKLHFNLNLANGLNAEGNRFQVFCSVNWKSGIATEAEMNHQFYL
jgi:hypothetical protein